MWSVKYSKMFLILRKSDLNGFITFDNWFAYCSIISTLANQQTD